jgi:hypothetical protein
MTNNVLMMMNVFWPYKDYSNFLGGKLTIFKLCNYDKGNGEVFGIILNYFIVYDAYFIVDEF